MHNTHILEEEEPAVDRMKKKLFQASTEVNIDVDITARLNSIKESLEYIACTLNADSILANFHLPDVFSFAIWSHTGVAVPVIFSKDYDTDRNKVFFKYKKHTEQFFQTIANPDGPNPHLFIKERKKARLVVQKGRENIALKLEDIVLIYTQDKLVYVIDQLSKKYIANKTLSELDEELDHTTFFRVNRQYIININYVKSFRSFEKVKLLIEITIPEINHSIVISQETAPAFRKWMNDA